jgi:hypothetical protein
MQPQPNLFIIGSMKSGTTSLHNYLNTHPHIHMSENKEPGYFVKEMTHNLGIDWYLSLFSSNEQHAYVGESSTHYTKLPTHQGVADRIHSFNPDAKFVYVMRNPFERLVSHYWHEVRKLEHGGEHRGLLQAVEANPEYLAFSNYAMQLQPYIKLFGLGAIYTLTFESLKKDPQGETNKIFTWLGLPSHDISDATGSAHNQKPEEIVGVAGFGVLNRLRHSRSWGYVSNMMPSHLKRIGNRLAEKRIDETIASKDIPLLKKKISALQRQQIDELSALLHRDFPEWLSIDNG